MKLAVLAGKGEIVSEALEHLRDKDPLVIALTNSPEYEFHYKFSPSEAGRILGVLKKESVEAVFFIGKFEKKDLLSGLKLDLTAIRILTGLRSFSDDAIMNRIVEFLTSKGIRVLSQKEALAPLLAPSGSIAGRLSSAEKEDVLYGFKIAKEIGRLGIGQTVAVKKKSVVAVEAVEGTDETIKRAGRFAKDFVVVKVIRPGQNDLMDLPVVGPRTLEAMKEAGAKVLAVEAKNTLVLGRNFRDLARSYGIKVYGVSDEDTRCSR